MHDKYVEVGRKGWVDRAMEGRREVPKTAATRAKYAIQETILCLERLTKDSSKTGDVKHESAKLLFQNVKKEVVQSIDTIRGYGHIEAEVAKDSAGFSFWVIDGRRMRLVTDALQKFDPDDVAHMVYVIAVGKEGDLMRPGIENL